MKDLASGIAASVFLGGGGVYLKWAAAPVLVAFELGRIFERMRARGGEKAAGRGLGIPPEGPRAVGGGS